MPRGVYVVRYPAASVSAAQTLIQLKAGPNCAVRVLRAVVSQTGSTTSTDISLGIVRKSSPATVTSATPLLTSPNDAAAQSVGGTSATGIVATVEGTDSDVPVDDSWNILTPWVWVPTPEERVELRPADVIGLKIFSTPSPALTVKAFLVFQEIP